MTHVNTIASCSLTHSTNYQYKIALLSHLKLISNKESGTPDDNLPVTLIPAGTPIPARKSYHLTEKDIKMNDHNFSVYFNLLSIYFQSTLPIQMLIGTKSIHTS